MEIKLRRLWLRNQQRPGFGWWRWRWLGLSRALGVFLDYRVRPYLGLIRFGGHLPKGEYDVDHDGHEGQADAAELHG